MQTDVSSPSLAGPTLPDFEDVIELHYRSLYQFALSLTGSEADAADLTQQTFYTWRLKGTQLRDASKVKPWLFTTLHRAFLQSRRRETRFPHYELSQVDAELPMTPPPGNSVSDSQAVLTALAHVEEVFRAPLALFYLDDCTYGEIARILNVPLGTVKSRIARGLARLQKLLSRPGVRHEPVANGGRPRARAPLGSTAPTFGPEARLEPRRCSTTSSATAVGLSHPFPEPQPL